MKKILCALSFFVGIVSLYGSASKPGTFTLANGMSFEDFDKLLGIPSANSINQADSSGQTILHRIISQQSSDFAKAKAAAKMIVQHGAQVHLQDQCGESPLACAQKHKDTLPRLYTVMQVGAIYQKKYDITQESSLKPVQAELLCDSGNFLTNSALEGTPNAQKPQLGAKTTYLLSRPDLMAKDKLTLEDLFIIDYANPALPVNAGANKTSPSKPITDPNEMD